MYLILVGRHFSPQVGLRDLCAGLFRDELGLGLQGWGVWCEFLGSSKKTEDAVIKDDDKNES